MNKKGFVFVETIVMCVILMIGLLIIYNSYTSSIAQQKSRLAYNTTSAELKLNMIKKYLINKYNCPKSNGCVLTTASSTNLKGYVEQEIQDLYGITDIYLFKCNYDTSDININGKSDLNDYIKTLKTCNYEYRFIAKFNDKSYAWVPYPVIN